MIVGDGNFGIFSFAYAVVASRREVLFRLTRADAAIEGRLIVVTQKGFRDSLYLFTTLSEETEAGQIVAWYRQRWNLEPDLRTLKGTLRLKHTQGKSKAVVEKELLVAVVAYGMVRALTAEAAERAAAPARAELLPRPRTAERDDRQTVLCGRPAAPAGL